MKRRTIKEIQEWFKTYGFGGGTLIAFLAVLAIIYRLLFVSLPPDLRKLPPPEQQKQIAEIIKGGDISQCERAKGVLINGANYKSVCKNNIAAELAVSRLDSSFCAQISDSTGLALRQCQEAVLLGQMRKEKDIEVCDRAVDQEMAKNCQSFYWQEQASAGRSVKACSSLPTAADQQNCRDRSLLSLLAQQQSVKCTELSKPLRPDCLAFKKIMASGQSNISACNNISIDELAMACRLGIGIKSQTTGNQ